LGLKNILGSGNNKNKFKPRRRLSTVESEKFLEFGR
jgi:hypothetical protein